MEDEQRLWTGALGDDGRAFAALFRLHERRVFRQALRVLAEPADAEEAAAAAFFGPASGWSTGRCCLGCW